MKPAATGGRFAVAATGTFVLATAFLGVGSCGGDDVPASGPPALTAGRASYGPDGRIPGLKARATPDVAIVCVSGIRYDLALGGGNAALGTHAAPSMSHLAAFARDATSFSEAASAASWELPSFAALLTGMQPASNGVQGRPGSQANAMIDANVTLAEVLRGVGYATAVFTEGAPTGERSGLLQGFDERVEEWRLERGDGRVAEWLSKRPKGKPCLLVLHGIDLPTAVEQGAAAGSAGGAPAREQTAQPARLAWTDARVAEILDLVESTRLSDDAVIVVASDFGVALGERAPARRVGRGGALFDENVHVPLVIRAKGRMVPGVVRGSCGLVDVMPTILDMLGLPLPRDVRGKSLLPLAADPKAPGRPIESEDHALEPDADGRLGERCLTSIRTATAKYISHYDGRTRTWTEQVFDLAADPGETKPLPADRVASLGKDFADAVGQVRDALAGKAANAKDIGDKGYGAGGSGCAAGR